MTLFGPAAIEKLAEHLGCSPSAVQTDADMIEAAILEMRESRKMPTEHQRKGLEAGANKMAATARLLREIQEIGTVPVYGHPGGPTLEEMEFAARVVDWAAGVLKLAAHPHNYWAYHGVSSPIKGQNALSKEATNLWPVLVEIWRDRHGEPAGTENGRFYRFVAFVHKLAGVRKPSLGTLRSALPRKPLKEARYAAKLQRLGRLYPPAPAVE